MKSKLIKIGYLFIAAIAIISCNDDKIADEIDNSIVDSDTINVVPVEKNIKSGYIINSTSITSAGTTRFIGHFEEKPTGDIDLSTYSSINTWGDVNSYNGFLYARPFDGTNGYSKLAVNKETNKLEQVAIIPTDERVRNVTIINDELGFYTITGIDILYVFNPTTMLVTNQIDISQALSPTINNFSHYIQAAYRAQDNKVFLFAHINDPNTGPFYDANTIYAEVVSLDSNSWESTAILDNAQYPFNRGSLKSVIDEDGNIYVTCQGSYSLDGQAGPTAAIGSRPQIVKIPAGSTEFDKDYRFNPVNAAGFPNLVAQFFTGAIYDANGIAYAAVSAKEDSVEILLLVQKLGLGTITSAELNQLSDLVLNSPTSKWAKLDLNAQTATIIDGMPFIAGYVYSFSTKFDDKILFQTYNLDEGINGYYELDTTTGTSSLLYSLTGGSGLVGHIHKLEENE